MEIWVDKHAFTQHVLQWRNQPLKSFLETKKIRKLGANQKLKSGIFCVLESGNVESSTWNPESIARNPESNTILDYLTWGDFNHDFECWVQLLKCYCWSNVYRKILLSPQRTELRVIQILCEAASKTLSISKLLHHLVELYKLDCFPASIPHSFKFHAQVPFENGAFRVRFHCFPSTIEQQWLSKLNISLKKSDEATRKFFLH